MANEYAILYLEINLFSIILIGIILYKTHGLSKMVAQRNFAMSIVAEMVFFASDTLFVLINTEAVEFGTFEKIIMLLCKTIYFFSTAMMCFFWLIYFEHLRDTAFVKEKKMVRTASSILWAMGMLLIVNLFTGILFYVDAEDVYHRGPYFILTYVFSYVYVLLAFIRTLRQLLDKSYVGDRHILRLLAVFPIAPAVAGILQFIYPRLPVACGVLSLTTLLLYLNWIDQLISVDPLTGLNNRKHMLHYYEQWAKNHGEGDRIWVMMIDANKFKSINDTYGHVQGDQALKNIAEALRQGCRIISRRNEIARYGGDEFAILFDPHNPEEALRLKENIKQQLDVINERSGIPFTLTISIGMASSDGSLSLKELIGKADEEMYKEKEKSRR